MTAASKVSHSEDRSHNILLLGISFILVGISLLGPVFYANNPDYYNRLPALVLLPLLLLIISWKEGIPRWGWIETVFFLWVLWISISSLWSLDTFTTWERVQPWALAFILFLLARHLDSPEGIIWAVAITGVLTALTVIFQKYISYGPFLQFSPPAATFGNKNLAGSFMILCFPAACISEKLRKKSIYLNILFAIIIAFAIYATQSRAVWLAFLLQILVLGTFLYRKSASTKMTFIIIGIVIILTGAFLASGGGSKIRYLGTEIQSAYETVKYGTKPQGSGAERLPIWANTLPMIKDNFVKGVGAGNWDIYYPKYQYIDPVIEDPLSKRGIEFRPETPHNEYLAILSELGIIGFLLFIGVVYGVIDAVLRYWQKNSTRCIGVIMALLGLLTIAFFSFPFSQTGHMLVFAAWFGVLMPRKTPYNFSIAKIGSRAIAIAVVVWSVLTAYPMFQAGTAYGKAIIAKEERNFKIMELGMKRAIDYQPKNNKPLSLLAQMYYRMKRYQDAIPLYETLLERFPYNPIYLNTYASLHHELGNHEKSQELVERFHKVVLQHPEADKMAISNHMELGNHEKAFKAATYYLNRHDDKDGLVRFTAGYMAWLLEDYTHAREHLLAYVALKDGGEDRGFYLLGTMEKNKGNLKTAKNYYEKALKANPNSQSSSKIREFIKALDVNKN